MAVGWTRRAFAALGAISSHIDHDNPARATRFAEENRAKTEMLVEFSAKGRPGRVTGTRELIAHENDIVRYRVRGPDVEIITVQHVAKRWQAVFD